MTYTAPALGTAPHVPPVPATTMDLVGQMIRWEDGEMSPVEELDFLRLLRDNGLLRTLQGAYGRRARALGLI